MPIEKKPKADTPKKTYEKPVSLFPLDFETAMKGLLGVPHKQKPTKTHS